MGIFRKYKTIEELLPSFLLEKQTNTLPKTARGYVYTIAKSKILTL
jgi:hypothetical protein